LAVDHGHRIVGAAHFAGADRMKNRGADQARRFRQFFLGAVVNTRLEFLGVIGGQRGRSDDTARQPAPAAVLRSSAYSDSWAKSSAARS
jgi:hypothetical protein